MKKLQICIAGKNKIAVEALLHLINNGLKDQLLVCPNCTDDGKSNWQPSLTRFAKEFGVRIVDLESAQNIQDLVFISLEFDKIILPGKFKSRRLYNIHFSKLPAYKGMYTSALPILHGATASGVTLHKIDHGIDTGPIIAQAVFDLPKNCTARDLYFLYMGYGLALFRENLDLILGDPFPAGCPQRAEGSSYFSKKSLNYNSLCINLQDTAEGVVRQLRAFSFREYQSPVVAGMEVGDWEISSQRSSRKAGSYEYLDDDKVKVSTVDFDLILSRCVHWEWFGVTAKTNNSVLKKLDGININIRDVHGWTPLIKAVWRGDLNLCRILLNFGADPNVCNMNGTTPAMYAYSNNKPTRSSVIELLIEHGADIGRKDFFGKSIVDYHSIN